MITYTYKYSQPGQPCQQCRFSIITEYMGAWDKEISEYTTGIEPMSS